MDSIKSVIKDDIQKDENRLNKLLEFWIDEYLIKFGKKDIENKVYKESEKIIDKYIDDNIEQSDKIRLDALKYILEEHLYKEGKSYKDNNFLYPVVGDPLFSQKIYNKKEFRQYELPEIEDGVENLEKLMKEKCSVRKINNTQKLLKNFISPNTPYNSLLIYHGVGVGKTCASISIAENFNKLLKNDTRKIYILVPPSIEENFKSQIIDISKLDKSNDEIRKQCTTDIYLNDKLINKLKKIKNDRGEFDYNLINKIVKRIIKKNYEFLGYEKFVNMIIDIEKNELYDFKITQKKSRTSLKDKKTLINNKIKKLFSNSIIIVDEAHNVTMKTTQNTKNKKIKLKKTLKGGSDLNSSIGEDSIEEKLEDNITSIKDKEKKIENLGKRFPPILRKVLKTAENIKLILLTATPMFNRAEEIVDLINYLLINDRRTLLKIDDIFSNGDITKTGEKLLINKISGYVSYLRGENPINFPQKIYPVDCYKGKYPIRDIKGNKLDNKINFLKIVDCEMSGFQWDIYKKYFHKNESESNFFDTIGLQICNMVFDNINDKNKNITYIENHYGTRGFKNYMDAKITNDKKLKVECKDDKFIDLFKLENIKNYSSKIFKILEGVEKSKGICFIYSQFKWAGVYVIAIALELLGYTNYGKVNILPNKYKIKKNGKSYLLITGDSNEDFIKYKKQEHHNKDGNLLKLILGTKAAGEGLNIAYVREVHILEPWYHLNRLEQVIGRGIRNCSHKDLDIKDRNVTVFLYCVKEPKEKNIEVRETLDMKLYRMAEQKIEKIGKVMAIIKNSSIDCLLNRNGNLYIGDKWNKPIKMIDSRNNKRDVIIEDQPFTNVCNYSSKCEIKCNIDKNLGTKIDNTTYKIELSDDNIKECYEYIKLLFKKIDTGIYFELKDIIGYLNNEIKNKELIYETLEIIINDKLSIYDKNDNEGYLIYRGNINGKYYIFQPKKITKEVPLVLRKLIYNKRIGKIRLDKIITKKQKKQELKRKTIKSKNYYNKIMNFILKLKFIEIEEDGKVILDKTIKKEKQKPSIDIGSYGENAIFTNNLLIEKELDFSNYLLKCKIIEYIIIYIKEFYNNNKLVPKDLRFELDSINRIKYYEIIRMKNNYCINYTKNKIIEDVKKTNRFNDIEITFFLETKICNLIRYIVENHIEYNKKIGYEGDLSEDFIGYKIANKGKLEFYKYINNAFIDCDNDEISVLGTYKNDKRNIMRQNNILSKIYGVIETHGKNNELKFKIIDKTKEIGGKKTQIRTGYVCNTDKIENIKNILGYLDENKYINIGTGKDLLCNSIEVLMRYKNIQDNKIYHFNLENYLIYFNL